MGIPNWEQSTNLQRSAQLAGNAPLLVVELILAQTGHFAAGHVVNGSPILQRKVQHVKR
jgi:hypothetical protein